MKSVLAIFALMIISATTLAKGSLTLEADGGKVILTKVNIVYETQTVFGIEYRFNGAWDGLIVLDGKKRMLVKFIAIDEAHCNETCVINLKDGREISGRLFSGILRGRTADDMLYEIELKRVVGIGKIEPGKDLTYIDETPKDLPPRLFLAEVILTDKTKIATGDLNLNTIEEKFTDFTWQTKSGQESLPWLDFSEIRFSHNDKFEATKVTGEIIKGSISKGIDIGGKTAWGRVMFALRDIKTIKISAIK